MRSVMALSSPGFNGPFGRIEFQAVGARFQPGATRSAPGRRAGVPARAPAQSRNTPAERARCRPAFAGEEPRICRAMETRQGARFSPGMLAWIGAGVPDPHGRQGWTSLFGVDLWRANETKKARSVVALSRVPR